MEREFARNLVLDASTVLNQDIPMNPGFMTKALNEKGLNAELAQHGEALQKQLDRERLHPTLCKELIKFFKDAEGAFTNPVFQAHCAIAREYWEKRGAE